MIDAFVDTLEFFPIGLVYVVLGIAVLILAKLVQDIITSYGIDEELTEKSNVAAAVSITGYYFGVIVVFLGALYQPETVVQDVPWLDRFDDDFGWNILEVFVYSIAGIVVLNLARIVVDRLILFKFDTEKEIIEDQNAGSGAAEFGVYVAVGLVIAASTAGAGGGADDVSILDVAVRSLAFLGLGMIVLVLYALFYQFTTSYDIHAEIERDNVAVGVALGGNLIAMGVVTFKAVFGEFVGWSEGLAAFITFAVIGFALLYAVRRLVDLVLFPRVEIANELAVERNLGVAFIVSAVVISAALILFFAI